MNKTTPKKKKGELAEPRGGEIAQIGERSG
jgi:hypothetical protein